MPKGCQKRENLNIFNIELTLPKLYTRVRFPPPAPSLCGNKSFPQDKFLKRALFSPRIAGPGFDLTVVLAPYQRDTCAERVPKICTPIRERTRRTSVESVMRSFIVACSLDWDQHGGPRFA
jgi:hypothetical protein